MRFKNISKSILLRVWGEDASASYLQMHHFTYSVGAFLAPLVVAPFYESSAEDLCDSENNQDGEISSKFNFQYLNKIFTVLNLYKNWISNAYNCIFG